jgi:hypothetical protein
VHSRKWEAPFTFLEGRYFVTHFCLQQVTQRKKLKVKKRLHGMDKEGTARKGKELIVG